MKCQITMGEFQKLDHTKWVCKHHVVFIPKGSKKAFFWTCASALGRSVSPFGRTEGEPDRGRPRVAGSCVNDDFESAQICAVWDAYCAKHIPQRFDAEDVTDEGYARTRGVESRNRRRDWVTTIQSEERVRYLA